ncbi:hypothetical protein BLS_005082 [Venturia inaequalis]|uniref:chitin synthase n=1 Tax=Venturia inaequalis TaxID=5025 RepID=A0A8H3YU57_VENIN|nr:hypothetical protein BLS_005082 [Venturia inaequalis]RDI82798.1 hypothetical protein Vi05172_g7141 [Venturia inaequalis]
MAYNQPRTSTMSSFSNVGPRPGNNQSAQVSLQTLLNALHTSYSSAMPNPLETSTSLVVNTWATSNTTGPDGRFGGTTDLELARKVWEHARRRAEDGCVVLGSLHDSTPSVIAPFISCLPIQAPNALYTALEVIRAFTHSSTPANPSFPRYSSLAAKFEVSIGVGQIINASLALSSSGIDTEYGLLNVPGDREGYRAFDVFYYLLSSMTSQQREAVNAGTASSYRLLRRSGTFSPPSYVPTADDAAAGEALKENLRAIGIKGKTQTSLLMALISLLKLGDSLDGLLGPSDLDVNGVYDEVEDLLNLQEGAMKKNFSNITDRSVIIAGLYEAIVDYVIQRANDTMREELAQARAMDGAHIEEEDETVNITVISVPGQELGKAIALRTVFDDSIGINLEMKEDGVPVAAAGSSVLREMQSAIAACEPDLNIMTGAAGHRRNDEQDQREGLLHQLLQECDDDSFIRRVLQPEEGHGIVLGKAGRFNLSDTVDSSRVWFHLNLHPTDDDPSTLYNSPLPWSAAAISRQLRAWRLPEWSNRRNRALDYTVDFDLHEFFSRYCRLGCQEGKDGIQFWLAERGWTNGEVFAGEQRVWMREAAWWEAETLIEALPPTEGMLGGGMTPLETGYSAQSPGMGGGFFSPGNGSRDNLLQHRQSTYTLGQKSQMTLAPSVVGTARNLSSGDYGLGRKGDTYKGEITYDGEIDAELADGKIVVEEKVSKVRKVWVGFIWAATFWIPSPLLRWVGQMKRPDVRFAWREKLVLVTGILLLNAFIVFFIIAFGKLLCPNFDKAWSAKEVSTHQGETDYYVSHMGKVYDLSKFWKLQHSDTNIKTTSDMMLPLAGTNVDELIRPPLTLACPHLVSNAALALTPNTTVSNTFAVHVSGPAQQTTQNSALYKIDWYTSKFLPKMKTYYKGDLVYTSTSIKSQGTDNSRMWFTLGDRLYDMTDYFYDVTLFDGNADFSFFPSVITDAIKADPGGDMTSSFKKLADTNSTMVASSQQCLDNYFYAGRVDFRQSVKCQVTNYLLLAFTIILCAVILVKFLAALQLGSKRRPAPQDKFVICQVPAYTEGEDQLRKGLDSLTALQYDNKRKLICVICDGMIVGGGNDRPTPKIVLDVLGVDPKIDPPALPFKSVGAGAEQLNYGKVYSGLYEYEGNVVPYLVVVKVGRESEQTKSKPGNRGKRDSQILLMSFLNRVHHRTPMSPLELEMFHQINNVIGVDPELYEYIFMVDADTSVKEDSLNRLVAACANDKKIAGICGETSLENEERSWWTMIQVYEYYISHHLAKAFESLFGSVTCLPGCFCMYRLRTADKGKPLIISDQIIADYSVGNIDTLHLKNLYSLGEDRYLTTLMTKYYPSMSMKFVPSALALTAAPETWSVLLSQRRRWINSTIHNLFELIFIKDMCGFCCFSMRFVVFIDLFGTLILPATCGYLAYLIYNVASNKGQFPLISIIMLAAVYGLQAVIFIIKRQWQHIGWMIIYILAFPIYSFVLPLYSFWHQDDFSWGNTRVVIGEKGDKQLVAIDQEELYDPRSIPLQRWDDYASLNNLPGRRGLAYTEKTATGYDYDADEMQSQYSSVQPASTILTGFPNQGHMPPRQSTYSNLSAMQGGGSHENLMSMGGISERGHSPYGQRHQTPEPYSQQGSTPNLLGVNSQPNRLRSPLLAGGSRPVSQVNFMDGPSQGPSHADITETIQQCLREVDLDSITKKQLRSLTEQRLQTQLTGEKRAFLDNQIDIELASMVA